MSPRTRNRRTAMITTLASVVAIAVVAVLAVIAPGYSNQKLDLDDGSVWVVNAAKRMVGHANTQLAKLSTAINAAGNSLSLIQDPQRLVVYDAANNTLTAAEPAEAKLATPVPLPAGGAKVVSTGTTLLTYVPESGDMWVTPIDSLGAYTFKSEPTRSLGSDAVLAADDQQRFIGYSMHSGEAIVGSLAVGAPSSHTYKVTFTKPGKQVQAAVVAGKPVLFDPTSNELWIDGKTRSLQGVVESPSTAMLSQSTTSGNRVLLADKAGLIAVPLDSGKATRIASSTGTPAAPTRLGGCDYGVWAGGQALRMCDGKERVVLDLSSMRPSAEPTLVINGPNVVASDPETGRAWAVGDDGSLIDNWSDFAEIRKQKTKKEEPKDVPPTVDKDQKPPVAKDDDFGVRAGRANELPVLLNDFDPNGDPLVITRWSGVPKTFGTVALVNDGQKLQITTTAQASGTITFQYWISDGHTGDVSANVTLTVYGKDHNSPPAQQRTTRTSVASGNTATIQNVLSDWVDPESDPMYLEDASTSDGGKVRFTPNGKMTFTDSGSGGALKTITLTVSDGASSASGTALVSVFPKGTAPLIAESFTMTGYTDEELKIEPLTMVRGGNGPITLSEVRPEPADQDLAIVKDYENGSFTVNPGNAGTHFLRYTVTDGTESTFAIIRLEISDPPTKQLPPVTVPDTAFLNLQKSRMVDVLANDYDPSGGVLSITGVSGIPPDSGIIAETLERRVLRVTLMKNLTDPVTITYTAGNGLRSAKGTLTLVQVQPPAKLQPPVANPDKATVRVGSVIDIPVLANDTQANNEPLFLDRTLVRGVGKGNGTAFTSGDKVRYLAPDKPGEYTLIYKVLTTDGQSAQAPVTISVRGVDRENNHAPVPRTVTSRVATNEKVVIPIPLSGIDPDGDLTDLVGQAQASKPSLGAITKVNSDSIEYTAGRVPGTDVFKYTVHDSLGAEGTGTIRVGVGARSDTGTPPIATNDMVTVRPGTALSVPVLDNDSNPDGGRLNVVGVEKEGSSLPDATTTKTRVKVTAPAKPGSYAVMYIVRNDHGGTSRAWLMLQVRADAPLIAPSASDIPLKLADIDRHSVVSVDTMKAVRFSEASSTKLKVTLPTAPRGSSVDAAGKARIPVLPKSRIVPFTVSRTDDPRVSASAFIWIPGSQDAAPDLRPDAPALTVVSGKKLTIPINKYVLAINDRKVTVADPTTVSATHADSAASLVQDDSTLAFTSAPGYWGPASISFTATDGHTKAPLVLAITVVPAQDQPPVVKSGKVLLETAKSTEVNLNTYTQLPDERERKGLTFTAESQDPQAVATRLKGSTLTLSAVGATPGKTVPITIKARTRGGLEGKGSLAVGITASTRPLVSAMPDKVVVKRGSSERVDVLANDEPTNPFAEPLKVRDIQGPSATGVTATLSSDKRTVVVAVSATAPTGNTTFTYRVADASGEAGRLVTGQVTVSIQDVPDAPGGAPQVVAQDTDAQTVTLSIPQAFPNASPITRYTVTGSDGKVLATCSNPASCKVPGIEFGKPYQFKAFATNEVGDGRPSAASGLVIMDVVPDAPASVSLAPDGSDRGGHTLTAKWSAVSPSKGTAMAGYDLVLTGPSVHLTPKVDPSTTNYEFRDGGISPGGKYTLTVRGRNKTHSGKTGSASTTAIGAPSLGAVIQGGAAGGSVDVSWTITSTGGANGVRSYVNHVAKGSFGGSTDCNAASPAGTQVSGTSWSDPDTSDSYDRVVIITNGLFCAAGQAGGTLAPTVRSATAGLADTGTGLGIVIPSVTVADGDATVFQFRLRSGAGTTDWTPFDPSPERPVSGAVNGTAYHVDVRACNGGVCGPGKTASGGTLVPITYALADGLTCTAGQPISVTAPDNGTVKTVVQLRFTVQDPDSGDTSVSPWAAIDEDTTVPANTRSMEVRVVISSKEYPYADNPVRCD